MLHLDVGWWIAAVVALTLLSSTGDVATWARRHLDSEFAAGLIVGSVATGSVLTLACAGLIGFPYAP
jgi:hypothetical protein